MVAEVQEKVGKKYSVTICDEPYCRCYPGDLRGLGFTEIGEGIEIEISAEALVEYERTVFLPRAKKRSLMLLGKKEYTKKEMTKKLSADGYPKSVTEAVLAWLAELHYVEDVAFAERYAFHLLACHSEREIVQKMQLKGFEKDLIKEALVAAKERYREEYSGGSDVFDNGMNGELFSPEQQAIRTFLRKKGYRPETVDDEKKKKLVMSLCRKGFTFSDIRAVLGEVEVDCEY